MIEKCATQKLTLALDRAMKMPSLVELGGLALESKTLETDQERAALVWLHLAATYLKFSVIADLGEFYCAKSERHLSELGFGTDILEVGGSVIARNRAYDAYQEALALNPELAEAHFGIGRVIQLQNSNSSKKDDALRHFKRCLELTPHTATPPHAYLHANANWESACLLEEAGNDTQALVFYRQALSLLPTFGAHHIRVARFFRRLGLTAEAGEQYLVCARYTHRYFPEFILPSLDAGSAKIESPTTKSDEIFRTAAGESIYFDNGQYILVPPSVDWPTVITQRFGGPGLNNGLSSNLTKQLMKLFGFRQPTTHIKRAVTIVELIEEVAE